MAWNNDPKVRDLGEYADKHGFLRAIVVGIRADDMFETITYGKTAALCKEAKAVGDQIHDEIADGYIDIP